MYQAFDLLEDMKINESVENDLKISRSISNLFVV